MQQRVNESNPYPGRIWQGGFPEIGELRLMQGCQGSDGRKHNEIHVWTGDTWLELREGPDLVARLTQRTSDPVDIEAMLEKQMRDLQKTAFGNAETAHTLSILAGDLVKHREMRRQEENRLLIQRDTAASEQDQLIWERRRFVENQYRWERFIATFKGGPLVARLVYAALGCVASWWLL